MKKYLIILLAYIAPGIIYAGDWIAVDGGVVEVKLNKAELEEALWSYIKKASASTFQPIDKYTYQYQAINQEEIHINALCDTFDNKQLNKQFITVFDGGSCFFQINYNLKTGKFSKLQINGEA